MLFQADWINFETQECETVEIPRVGRSCGYYKKNEFADCGSPCPYFRKEFSLDKKVRKATLNVSAMGVVKAYLNGLPVADDYLSPGFADYRKRLPLVTFDVTDKLKQSNALGLIAGDGWAVGFVGNRMERNCWSDKIAVAAELIIEYADGTVGKIVTDNTWKACAGEIRHSDIYMGECVDHRMSLGDFSVFGYDDSDWSDVNVDKGTLDGNGFNGFCRYADKQRAPVITVKHILEAKFLHRDSENRLVYDFSQNIAGVIALTVKGERGTTITVRHGEMLEKDGSLYTANLRRAKATDEFILSGDGEEKFRPLFTFHGFRYADIKIDGKAEIIDIKSEIMYTDLKKTGCFKCSDELVNKLYENIVWGQRGNFLSVPTDCPQRDERLGWTGDAQIFVGTAMFNMDCKAFYEKYICDMRDAQLGNGAIPGIVPVVPHHSDYIEEIQYISAGWADAITVIPTEHYKTYGDIRVLTDNLSAMKAFVRYCEETSDNYIRGGNEHYGDWLNVNDFSDFSVLATQYFAFSAANVAYACRVLKDKEEQEFTRLYENIRKAFRKTFVDENGVIKSDSQTVYLLAYSFGLMSKDEIKPNLLRKIHSADDHLTTGFLGVKFLLPTLCEIGERDLAYKILTNRTYPGWGYSIVNGATTIWERWNSYTTENGFGDVGMNSFNHYSLGSCGEWMFKYALGINPCDDKVGYKKVKFRPFVDFSGKLTSADGYYDSIAGRIEVKWKTLSDGRVEYTPKVPESIENDFDFSAYSSVEKVGNSFILKA